MMVCTSGQPVSMCQCLLCKKERERAIGPNITGENEIVAFELGDRANKDTHGGYNAATDSYTFPVSGQYVVRCRNSLGYFFHEAKAGDFVTYPMVIANKNAPNFNELKKIAMPDEAFKDHAPILAKKPCDHVGAYVLGPSVRHCANCHTTFYDNDASTKDNINPDHYKSHPSGIECITITEHMDFCIGSALKYLWRCGRKGDAIEDLEKALWYIKRKIELLKQEKK